MNEVTLVLGAELSELLTVADEDDIEVFEGRFEECVRMAPRSAGYSEQVLGSRPDLSGSVVKLGAMVGPTFDAMANLK